MELNEAKELLNLCEREELRDHAFGDREVFWTFDGQEAAGGYFGGDGKSIWIMSLDQGDGMLPMEIASFKGEDVRELVECGKLKHIERNDMQGDDIPRYMGA